jgi:hypothetical protein
MDREFNIPGQYAHRLMSGTEIQQWIAAYRQCQWSDRQFTQLQYMRTEKGMVLYANIQGERDPESLTLELHTHARAIMERMIPNVGEHAFWCYSFGIPVDDAWIIAVEIRRRAWFVHAVLASAVRTATPI